MRSGAHGRHPPCAPGLEVARGGEARDVCGARGRHGTVLVGSARSHLGDRATARGDRHACRRRGDRRVEVQHAQRERFEDDGIGEGGLDREQRRLREVQLALAVSLDRSREPVALEVGERLTAHDALVVQVAQVVVGETEIAQQRHQSPLARDDAEPPTPGQAPAEQLEHASAMRGAIAQRRIEHREFVTIRQQRGRLKHDRHSTGVGTVAAHRSRGAFAGAPV